MSSNSNLLNVRVAIGTIPIKKWIIWNYIEISNSNKSKILQFHSQKYPELEKHPHNSRIRSVPWGLRILESRPQNITRIIDSKFASNVCLNCKIWIARVIMLIEKKHDYLYHKHHTHVWITSHYMRRDIFGWTSSKS